MINQNSAIRQASVNPSVRALIGKRNLLARLASNLSRHDVVSSTFRVFPIPDGCIGSIARPSLVEICVVGIGNLMKTGTICIDDANGCLPFADIGIIFEAAKEDKHVTGLRPGRFEIPMARS